MKKKLYWTLPCPLVLESSFFFFNFRMFPCAKVPHALWTDAVFPHQWKPLTTIQWKKKNKKNMTLMQCLINESNTVDVFAWFKDCSITTDVSLVCSTTVSSALYHQPTPSCKSLAESSFKICQEDYVSF